MPFVCWAGLQGKWCMALWTSCFWNSLVHVVMYTYFVLCDLGIRPWWKKYLTGLQIYQFVSGVLYTSIYFYYYLQDLKWNLIESFPYVNIHFKQGCVGDLWAVIFMFAVNISFLLLFSQFYVQNYQIKPITGAPPKPTIPATGTKIQYKED